TRGPGRGGRFRRRLVTRARKFVHNGGDDERGRPDMRRLNCRTCIPALLGFFLLPILPAASAGEASTDVNVRIDAQAHGTPFPHTWEDMFGSGRASLSLRDDYRKDLEAV